MMVKIFATLRQYAGKKEVEVPLDAGDTVGNVMVKLTAEYPALGQQILDGDGNLQSSIIVLLNGRNIKFLDGLESTLQESDRIALLPLVGGG